MEGNAVADGATTVAGVEGEVGDGIRQEETTMTTEGPLEEISMGIVMIMSLPGGCFRGGS